MSTTPAASQQAIVIDGQAYTLDDLSFREERELRRLVRVLADAPELLVGDAALMDFLPALAAVIKHRSSPDGTSIEDVLEETLDWKFGDVIAERPTPAAAAKPVAKKSAK